MQKKFTENPALYEILAQYKKSELSAHLSFYEYCQVTVQVNQMMELNELVDHLRIEHSMRENFSTGELGGLDDDTSEI